MFLSYGEKKTFFELRKKKFEQKHNVIKKQRGQKTF
jgi:hypothetical protein